MRSIFLDAFTKTMDKKQFIAAIAKLKEQPKREFKQTYELIINLRGLDLKKPEHQVEFWTPLPHDKGMPIKIGALVGPEMAEQAKANCDIVITHENFKTYTEKKKIKQLASQYDYFIAQANLMADVAKYFGRYFGPRGKMPNPKAGCVVPPNSNLKALCERLRKTIKVSAKLQPAIRVPVGKEEMKDEDVAENMHTIYTTLVQNLPQEKFNVKNVMVKLTMSKPVKIEEAAK